MSKRLQIPKKTVAYGWASMWHDNHVGWWMPEHLHPNNQRNWVATQPAESDDSIAMFGNGRAYLCKITVEPVLTKPKRGRGKPITRIKRRKKEYR